MAALPFAVLVLVMLLDGALEVSGQPWPPGLRGPRDLTATLVLALALPRALTHDRSAAGANWLTPFLGVLTTAAVLAAALIVTVLSALSAKKMAAVALDRHVIAGGVLALSAVLALAAGLARLRPR